MYSTGKSHEHDTYYESNTGESRTSYKEGAAQGHLDFFRSQIRKQELKKRVGDESGIDNCWLDWFTKFLKSVHGF